MNIKIIKADYSNQQHRHDIPILLDAYATDHMGGGKPLSNDVKNNLVDELCKRPYAFTLLAYVDNNPAGLANCFESFSTFSCQPIVNIHDIAVIKEYRGNGISQQLLQAIEDIAIEKKCCKITLEVLSENHIAKSAYKKFGFSDYQLNPDTGTALFWQKHLT